jgi:hypothetical protein
MTAPGLAGMTRLNLLQAETKDKRVLSIVPVSVGVKNVAGRT